MLRAVEDGAAAAWCVVVSGGVKAWVAEMAAAAVRAAAMLRWVTVMVLFFALVFIVVRCGDAAAFR